MSPLQEFLGNVEREFAMSPPGNRNVVALAIAVGRLAERIQNMPGSPSTCWQVVEAEAVRVAALAARCGLKGDPSIAVPGDD